MTRRKQFILAGSGVFILIVGILYYIYTSNNVQTFIKCFSIQNGNHTALESSVDIFSNNSQLRSSSTTIPSTGLNIGIDDNDKMNFYHINHATTEVQFIHQIYLTELNVGLIHKDYQNTTERKVKGKIILRNSSSSVTNILITCDKCNTNVVNPDSNGNYEIDRTANGRTQITYKLNNKEIKLKVVSGNGDDLIHIDLAFDDGSEPFFFIHNKKGSK